MSGGRCMAHHPVHRGPRCGEAHSPAGVIRDHFPLGGRFFLVHHRCTTRCPIAGKWPIAQSPHSVQSCRLTLKPFARNTRRLFVDSDVRLHGKPGSLSELGLRRATRGLFLEDTVKRIEWLRLPQPGGSFGSAGACPTWDCLSRRGICVLAEQGRRGFRKRRLFFGAAHCGRLSALVASRLVSLLAT